MKNAVKLFLREWKYLLKRPRSLVLMVLVPIFVTCICGSGYGKGYFSDLKMGVVDYSYRGDNDQWHMPAYATRDVTIPQGARICQFRILENQPRLTFCRVERLEGPDRGGFGSTGK